MKAPRYMVLGLAVALLLGVAACNSNASEATADSRNPISTPSTALLTHPGKLLASNCFQCHGTDGKNGAFDSLAGESASELVSEMYELRTETDSDEAIMKVHALGYDDAQIKLIADYFSKVR